MEAVARREEIAWLSLRDVASRKALALDMLQFGPQSCFHLHYLVQQTGMVALAVRLD